MSQGYNPYRDPDGKFASGPGGAHSGGAAGFHAAMIKRANMTAREKRKANNAKVRAVTQRIKNNPSLGPSWSKSELKKMRGPDNRAWGELP